MPNKQRHKPPFWRRYEPRCQWDIAHLRPRDLPKGERFETTADARAESERSEKLLRTAKHNGEEFAAVLKECRRTNSECNETFCPLCARRFRRWFVGELLRIIEDRELVHIFTILLQEAKRPRINDLDPNAFRHLLRKRLQRCGLSKVAAIGGFEIIYRARQEKWVLHLNLAVIGGRQRSIDAFVRSFRSSPISRPVEVVPLTNPASQLSYILKFTTYHRPHEQFGARKSAAKPLNPPEHTRLVEWMSQFTFNDFLYLVNAIRRGPKLVLRDP